MAWVDAAPRTVAGVLRDAAFVAEVLPSAGHRLGRVSGRWLSAGDTGSVWLRVLPGIRLPFRFTVRAARPDEVAVDLLALTLVMKLVPEGTGTSVHDEVRGRPARPLRWLLRRRLPELRATCAELLVAWAAELATRRVVVATALLREGTVLAAQRTRPPTLAGRWELPGGRVEQGESETDAVVRECREELGCAVTPGGRVGTDLFIDAGVLRVHAATLIAGSTPVPLEHAAIRWVATDELEGIDWVDADHAILPDLRTLLSTRPSRAL